MLVLCGDLTDRGTEDEAQQLSRDLKVIGLPIVAVLGNHDFEAGQPQQVARILSDAGVHMLDGEAIEVQGVGFAGIKGFGGGFGRGALGPWGEPAIKAFVQEAVDEALKLETALARLRTPRKVAVLHYSPVRATVEDEPPEIFPVPRLQPSRGAPQPLPRRRRLSRPRARRPLRGTHVGRRARLQRRGAAAPASQRHRATVPHRRVDLERPRANLLSADATRRWRPACSSSGHLSNRSYRK